MKNVIHYTKLGDYESKGRFFLQNESIRIDSWFESIRESECSTCDQSRINYVREMSSRSSQSIRLLYLYLFALHIATKFWLEGGLLIQVDLENVTSFRF